MLVSDHPHLFETGGENYHTDFAAWDYLRGHEDDPWRTRPDPSFVGAPAAARPAGRVTAVRRLPHLVPRRGRTSPDRRRWRRPPTGSTGELGAARATHERVFLVVDEFDPHEPFDTPEPWATRYDADWEASR